MIQIDWHPDERKLRQFGRVWLVGFGLIGLLAAWRLGALSGSGRWAVPCVLWGLAAAVGLVALCAPRAARPIYQAWMALAFPVGWSVSHLIMALIYFGVLTPVAFVFRLIGRDAMKRKLKPGAPTYWEERHAPTPAERYFRQF